MHVVLRTCTSVPVVSGGERIGGIPKPELILRCARSLFASAARLPSPLRVTVVDDHSGPGLHEGLRAAAGVHGLDLELVELAGTGNGASLRACYELAREGEGLVYFVEDDYVHAPSCLDEMLDISERARAAVGPVVVHPCDYPDRYATLYPSFVVLGKARHWRTVRHTTGTFMLHAELLRTYWDHYLRFTGYGSEPGISEDTTINLVYDKVPCLSPLPSLALHYQFPSTISPYCSPEDWLRRYT